MTSPMDTLTSSDVQDLLRDKYVLILGDSIVRGLYKDLVNFFHHDIRSIDEELYVQGEKRFHGDQLLYTRPKKAKINAPDYEEAREFTGGGRVRIRFYFLSRCFPNYMKYAIFQEIQNQIIKPDVVIMNSCLRDIAEDNPRVMKYYCNQLQQMFSEFRQILPSETLFLWLSALPVSNAFQGCMIDPNAEYLKLILPGLIRDANAHCAQLCDEHRILYVDLHTTFSHMLHLRLQDGVRWDAVGIRMMNEMILHHILAYYSGIQKFKCIFLREQLSKKLIKYQQRLQGPFHQVNRSETAVSNDLLSVPRTQSDVKSMLTIKNQSKRNRNQENEAPTIESQLAKKAEVNEKPTNPNSKDSSIFNTKSDLINLKKQNVSRTILIPIDSLPENAAIKQEKICSSDKKVQSNLSIATASQASAIISVKQENEIPLQSKTGSKFSSNRCIRNPDQTMLMQERNVSTAKVAQPRTGTGTKIMKRFG